MTFLIGLFLRWGVTERFARPLAIGFAIIAAIALCASLWTCWLSSHNKSVIEADRNESNVKVLTDAIADNERANVVLTKEEKANDERIEQARGKAAASDDPLAAGFDSLRTGKN
jgi:hypothetical protein